MRAAKKYFELDANQVKAAFSKQIHPDDFVQVVRGPAPIRSPRAAQLETMNKPKAVLDRQSLRRLACVET